MKNTNKKLIIDGQILQTEAKDRGMGRYTSCLIQAICSSAHHYEDIEIILSSGFPDAENTKKEIQQNFDKAEITLLKLLTKQSHSIEESTAANQVTLDTYVAKLGNSSAEIDFLIPSLFQEPTAAVFPSGVKKLLLFYDLIPYLYDKRYVNVMPFNDYLKRFKTIFDADKIFTISQSVADDLAVYLGIPKDRLTTIDGAAIKGASAPKRPDIKLPENYILMPTSDDPRKNNLEAVLGFEEFLVEVQGSNCKLVITSTIRTQEQERLKQFSNNIIFTGNVKDSEMDWLYSQCKAVLFVPEYEGLGLPILEAVSSNKPVVCSNIAVFREISKKDLFYCNHENSHSIAEALNLAYKQVPSSDEYRKISLEYTWQRTAEKFLEAANNVTLKIANHKQKLAIFSPTPEGYSAIGKVVAESHASMSELFDIDYFLENGIQDAQTRPNYLQYVADTFSATDFSVEAYKNYDAVVYHLGNGDYHLESIKNALYLPGYAITHDTDLTQAFRVLDEKRLMSKSRVELEKYLNVHDETYPKFLTTILNRQLGILTHSEYAASAIKKILDQDVPILTTNLPTAASVSQEYKDSEELSIGLAGIIADIKGIGVIEALAAMPEYASCKLKLFGFSHLTQESAERLKTHKNITITTALSDFEFQANLTKLHVYMNYRLGYNGETSLSTLEAMSHGVVVVVRNIGWYSELPDDTVIKANSQQDAINKLTKLVNDRKQLDLISRNAKKYIAEHFTHYNYAHAIADLLEKSKSTSSSFNHQLAEGIKQGEINSRRDYLELIERGNTK